MLKNYYIDSIQIAVEPISVAYLAALALRAS